MAFQIDYIRSMYEKAYKEAIHANDVQNYPVAIKKFSESAQYLKRLATMDSANRDTYLSRAEKMLNISRALQDRCPPPAAQVQQQQQPGYNSFSGNGGAQDSFSQSNAMQDVSSNDMSSYYTFYTADELVSGFDKVIGLEEAKEAVTEYVINPIRYPEAYNYSFLDSKCILLEGPPGTGKTTFAKAGAKEIEQPFALVNVASLVNCYVGETGKIIDKVFNSLRQYVEENNCGVTVFFDEFDEIAKSRGGDDKSSQTAVPALLRNLDGVTQNKNFLIIANTNCKEMLDAGILSRFRRKIFIPLPDKAMRIRFFTDKLGQLEPDYFNQLNLEQLAEESDGLSGRAIAQICDDFLHFIGGVKAGLRSCSDFNETMLNIIRKA